MRQARPRVRSGAQSPLESISRLRVVAEGIPEPRLQVPFFAAAGLIGFTDMAWDDFAVIGECDGMIKYDTGDALIREKLREDRLRALGYVVVRWTWREIMDSPGLVAARIRRAMAVGRGRGSPIA